jgi:succinate dehydrogenase / fumarate reductase membrane anchor subunit
MSTTDNIGPKRLVVGAHYGLRDWLAQRITAVVIGVYMLVLGLLAIIAPEPGYEGWASIFAPTWMKVFTMLALIALIYHAWVGVRDIWMDYVKPVGARLGLQIFTILWLVGCGVWAIDILWRV